MNRSRHLRLVSSDEVQADLGDPGRRARIYADLHRSLRPDVLVVDSGSGWDAEAAGFTLDWDFGYVATQLAGFRAHAASASNGIGAQRGISAGSLRWWFAMRRGCCARFVTPAGGGLMRW